MAGYKAEGELTHRAIISSFAVSRSLFEKGYKLRFANFVEALVQLSLYTSGIVADRQIWESECRKNGWSETSIYMRREGLGDIESGKLTVAFGNIARKLCSIVVE